MTRQFLSAQIHPETQIPLSNQQIDEFDSLCKNNPNQLPYLCLTHGWQIEDWMKHGFDPNYKYSSNFTLAMLCVQKGIGIKKWMRHQPDLMYDTLGKSDSTIAMMQVRRKKQPDDWMQHDPSIRDLAGLTIHQLATINDVEVETWMIVPTYQDIRRLQTAVNEMEEEMTTIKREIQNLKRPKTPIKKGCM